jgi:hypothetical protein
MYCLLYDTPLLHENASISSLYDTKQGLKLLNRGVGLVNSGSVRTGAYGIHIYHLPNVPAKELTY